MSTIVDGSFGVINQIGIQTPQTISQNYTFGSNTNSMSVGTVTIGTGYVITVPTGSRWVVV